MIRTRWRPFQLHAHSGLRDIPQVTVKQSAVITPLNGCSLIPLFGAGMMSVIASGMCNVSVLEMSIPMRRSPSGGPLYQAATSAAWEIPFPSRVYSLMWTFSLEKWTKRPVTSHDTTCLVKHVRQLFRVCSLVKPRILVIHMCLWVRNLSPLTVYIRSWEMLIILSRRLASLLSPSSRRWPPSNNFRNMYRLYIRYAVCYCKFILM